MCLLQKVCSTDSPEGVRAWAREFAKYITGGWQDVQMSRSESELQNRRSTSFVICVSHKELVVRY